MALSAEEAAALEAAHNDPKNKKSKEHAKGKKSEKEEDKHAIHIVDEHLVVPETPPLPPPEPIKPFISIKINTEQQPTVNELLLQRLSAVIDSLIPGRTGRHHQIYKFRDI